MTLFRGWRGVAAIALLAFVIAVPIGIAMVQPVLAALVCPRCFGFVLQSGELYVESTMPDETRAALTTALAEGEKKVADFYDGLRTAPRILACATRACVERLGGGGSKGAAYLSVGLRLAPDGLDPVIIAHERAHVELHGRIGLLNFWTGAIPTWFDEGLAAVVSDDPRYFRPVGEGDRCRAAPDGVMPERLNDWLKAASRDPALYARAACRVLRWTERNGGNAAILRLIERINRGEAFGPVYLRP
jgi:hypothetical protein